MTSKFTTILTACAALAADGAAFAEPLEGKLSSAEILAAASEDDWRALDPEASLYIELESGRVVIALSENLAQAHVANMKKLAREGFYDGLNFYRVIDGFVAQGGDVFGVRGETEPLAAQFDEPVGDDFTFYKMADIDGYAPAVGFLDSLPVGHDAQAGRAWGLHCTGALAMGREEARDTASTEFYITLQPQRYLDRNLTVIGRVVAGMEHIQALRRVSPPQSEDDDAGETILAIRVAADVAPEERTNLAILRSDRPVFDAYVEARRNRPEGFFYFRPDYQDVCQLPMPVKTLGESE